jgi:hypothetical protein
MSPELETYFAGNRDAWFIVPEVAERLEAVVHHLGIESLPRVIKFTPDLNDQQSAELRGGQRSTREETLVDYDLNGLDHVLKTIQSASAHLRHVQARTLWNLLNSLYEVDDGRAWEGEHRWYFRKGQVRRFPALFVRKLRDTPWLPTHGGDLRCASEMAARDLATDFPLHEKLVMALGFRDPESELIHLVEELGETIGVDFDDLQWIGQFPDQFRQWKRKMENLTAAPEFPERDSLNPERREEKVSAELVSAPEKRFETLQRSERVSKSSTDTKTWLRNQYTDDAGLMYCQMMHEVMPFKKRNGQYYFEAVEMFNDLAREHHAVYLALSPVAAAKYKEFVKTDPKTMTAYRGAILGSQAKRIPLRLGDEHVHIQFTDQHIRDLRTVLTRLAGPRTDLEAEKVGFSH